MSRIFSTLGLAIGWTILILILLSIPGENIPSVSILELDKVVHAGLFFVLTVLWLNALAGSKAFSAIVIVLVIIAFSFATEWYQGMLPFGRTADVFDAVADTVGALFGLAFWGFRRAFSARKK